MLSKSKNQHVGSKLISNTVYLFFDWFVIALFSSFFLIILAKNLNPSDVGIISTSINLCIFISGVSALGITTALNKLIPEIKEKMGLKGSYSLVKLSFKPLTISLLITFLILLFSAKEISSFVKIPYSIFLICIFSIIIMPIYDTLGSALYGLQKMKKYFITDLIQNALNLLFAILLIFLGFSFVGPMIGFFLAYLVGLFLRFDLNYFINGKTLSYKKLFFYATPALISTIAYTLITRGEYIILTILKTTEVTGIFTIGFTITSLIGVIMRIPSSGLFPIISALSVDKKTKKKQGYLIGLVLRYSLFFIMPLSLILMIFSKQAILLFSGPEFLSSTQYFPILILGSILYGIGVTFNTNLYAIGKPKLYRNIMVLTSAIFLSLSILLTYYFSALGLSISYFITMLFQFLASFIYIKRSVELNLFIGDLLKILFSSLVILSILFFIEPFIHNLFELATLLLPICLLYLLLLLFAKFYRIEDVRILKHLGEKIPNIKKYILYVANFIEKRLH